MPQVSQMFGVNSVTNIELDGGDMPAPFIRNANWLESFPPVRTAVRVLLLDRLCPKTPGGAGYADSMTISDFIQNSGKWPIY
jgi:hypothetical protein